MTETRIASYMKERGIKKLAVKEKLGLSYQGLRNKLEGSTEFTGTELATLAQWWGVSTDWLLGLTDE